MINLQYIDLFSGCGGLSLGLHKAGWKGIFAIEKSPDAFATLEHNLINKCQHFSWPEWLPQKNHDIKHVLKTYSKELKKLKGKVPLLVGGPPCQGFSMAGRRNEDDERNQLVNSYVEFVKIIKPKIIFFENVSGFTMAFDKSKTSKGRAYSLYVQEELQKLGYNVLGRVLDFSDYGVPQRRKRFILIGCLGLNPLNFFELMEENNSKFLGENKLNNHVTIKEAISDLLRQNGEVESPDSPKFKAGKYSKVESQYQRFLRCGVRYKGKVADSHRFANHKAETIEVFKYIIKNAPRDKRISGEEKKKYNLNRRGFFVLDKHSLAPTLTTNPDDYLHYCEPRILTVREYARIQSFPDWYEFKGKYTTGGKLRVYEVPRYTQLGNAIPPLFSEQAGIALKEMITIE
ncbi:DNA cytosine methyltransferase [Alkaliphilus transvaalensis]|uniref:DNA cytosine methyltransferase n=1 Tax=Alkaliphilus transvaalensis TaxID=114628 RepID=UPI00047EDC68|nr:DNA cytosine methyltransferase [Alkaliphilus transvaalensis]